MLYRVTVLGLPKQLAENLAKAYADTGCEAFIECEQHNSQGTQQSELIHLNQSKEVHNETKHFCTHQEPLVLD